MRKKGQRHDSDNPCCTLVKIDKNYRQCQSSGKAHHNFPRKIEILCLRIDRIGDIAANYVGHAKSQKWNPGRITDIIDTHFTGIVQVFRDPKHIEIKDRIEQKTHDNKHPSLFRLHGIT